MALQIPQIQTGQGLSQLVLSRQPETFRAPLAQLVPQSPLLAAISTRPDLFFKRKKSTFEKLGEIGQGISSITQGVAGLASLFKVGADILEKKQEKQAIKDAISQLNPTSSTALDALDNIIKEQASRGTLDTDELEKLLKTRKSLEEIALRISAQKSLDKSRQVDAFSSAARIAALGGKEAAVKAAELAGIPASAASALEKIPSIAEKQQTLLQTSQQAPQAEPPPDIAGYIKAVKSFGVEGARQLFLLRGVSPDVLDSIEQLAKRFDPFIFEFQGKQQDLLREQFTNREASSSPFEGGAPQIGTKVVQARRKAALLFPSAPIKTIRAITRDGKQLVIKMRIPAALLKQFTDDAGNFDLSGYVNFLLNQSDAVQPTPAPVPAPAPENSASF